MGFTTDRQEPGVEVDRWWLRMMSLACLLSIALHLALFTTALQINGIELEMSVGILWLLAGPVPYLHTLLGLRRNPPTRALMLGVIWGSLMAVLLLLLLPPLVVTEETGLLDVLFGLSQMVTEEGGLLYVLFGLSQIFLVSIAIKTYCKTRMESGALGNIARGALTAVPYLGILFVGAVVIPMLFGTVGAANEAWAIGSVRHLVASQIAYASSEGDGSYAPDLTVLHEAGWIDEMQGSDRSNGYLFATSHSSDGTSFAVSGRPVRYGSTGTRSFYADKLGVIRYTAEESPATADDESFGQ